MNGIEGFYTPSGRHRLFVALYGSGAQVVCERGFVLCPGFGEEAECARREFHDLAVALSRVGHAVLVPDLSGTGNSSGDFTTAGLSDWCRDIVTCTRILSERTGASRMALLGMRFGSLLALRAASSIEGLDTIVLWDPPKKPERLRRSLLQRVLVRRVVAQRYGHIQKTGTSPIADDLGDTLDLDGYLTSRALLDELGSSSWSSIPLYRKGLRLGLAQFSASRGSSTPPELAARLPQAEIETFYAARTRNFWSRLDAPPATSLIESTVRWVQSRVSGPL